MEAGYDILYRLDRVEFAISIIMGVYLLYGVYMIKDWLVYRQIKKKNGGQKTYNKKQ